MRVMMITDFYAPFLGGVEQHVRHLSTELVRRGHIVTVVTQSAPGLSDTEWDSGVKIRRIGISVQRFDTLFSQSARTWAPPFPDPEATWQIWKVIREADPDIVHGHDWLARSFLPLKMATRAKLVAGLHYYTLSCARKDLMYQGKPCSGPEFIKCQGCVRTHYGPARGLPIVYGNWLVGVAERRLVDLFLPVSQATAEGNGLVGGTLPYRVLPNFLPDDIGAPAADLAPYLEQLPNEPFLMYVGDLRDAKGLRVLLQAFANAPGLPPLVLIGKAWPETPTSFPSNVRVLHNWPNRAILAAWERSLFGIVPSLWPEPFGIVVIEAMAAGRPVVGSRIGGITDLVIDGRTGLLVSPGDVSALREALVRLSRCRELRDRLGAAAAEHSKQFRAHVVVPQYEDAYQTVFRSSREPV